MKQTLMLMIMDGFGISNNDRGNAIKAAKTPNIDKIFSSNPITSIEASGLAVGLPEGQMGNSEVGHTNMGAGRVVYQDLTRITKSIEDEDFFDNKALNKAMDNALKNHTALHLLGLLSDGGVHSHIKHVYAILELAKKRGLKEVYVHAFLDGRDVPPTSGTKYLRMCQDKMDELGVGKIATVIGRYYAMDRDKRYDRLEKAYDALVLGKGNHAKNAIEAVEQSYKDGVTDEFVLPTVIEGGKSISANDSVIFYNFRPDRAREITRAFVDDDFEGFTRKNGKFPLEYICMTEYDSTIEHVTVAFELEDIKNTFGEFLGNNGLTQLRIAETEKYAHVTFFFNGGVEEPYNGESRILVPSPKVATYDLQPEMSEPEVADKVVDAIKSQKYDVIILNFANCDMVGHTGVFEAAVKAVEAVDNGVGKVYDAINEVNGILLITADHGNADKMLEDDSDKPFTAHTTNKVPFCVINYPCELKETGKLADIIPTMIDIMKLKQPSEMTGETLIAKKL